MKRFSLIVMLSLFTFSLFAQENDVDAKIQKVYKACIAMRDAACTKDSAAIKHSAMQLKDCETKEFTALRSKQEQGSLDGHIVFDEEFANLLAEGKDVYQQSDSINRTRIVRGQTANGAILTKTCFVKAGKSVKYSFPSKNKQILAVVAEAGGRVTMKVHVSNKKGLNKRYDDTISVKQGLPNRKTTFMLPSDCMNIVELEVVNCSKKDISFVVISN